MSYESDYYNWIQDQILILKNNQWSKLDVVNLVEELEDMGKKELRSLKSNMIHLISHLLKWEHQSNKRSRSWQLTIKEQRKKIIENIGDNPSLKSKMETLLDSAYDYAVIEAEREIGLDIFPTKCPWTVQQLIGETNEQ